MKKPKTLPEKHALKLYRQLFPKHAMLIQIYPPGKTIVLGIMLEAFRNFIEDMGESK